MNSPFKFLDSYEKKDKEIFFGRQEDVEQLYNMAHQSNLVLVYGQSGTGKTSLIQCGLANRFMATDWFDLYIRRQSNINDSLQREIRKAARTPIKANVSLPKAIHSLYLDYLKPVYLIFDQFEELFILGSAREQQNFIQTMVELFNAGSECKIVIVMREEYIAMLYDFEKKVPTLFNKRFRVEPMSLQNVQQVITGTTAAFGIELEKGESTAQQIIDNLSDHRARVQLSYLQVYLDKLYRKAAGKQNGTGDAKTPVIFTEKLVQQTGALGDVMADFLEEQTTAIQKELKAQFPEIQREAVQLILEEFATLEGTKQPTPRDELSSKLKMPDPVIDACLSALEISRILRNIEGVYELAHDTLAGRIAERRSVERKNLLKVQKLIDDRFSAYEQTHTYLSKEELAFINPFLSKLNLDEDQTNFVNKSASLAEQQLKKEAQRIRSRVYNILLAFALVISISTSYYAYKERDRAEQTLNNLLEEVRNREVLEDKLAVNRIDVPNFLGWPVDSARIFVKDIGLNMVEIPKKTAEYQAETIFEQKPPHGTRVDIGTPVYLSIAMPLTVQDTSAAIEVLSEMLAGPSNAPAPKINPEILSELLPEIAFMMEADSILYGTVPLSDNSGIFHRMMATLKEMLPEIGIPDVDIYRSTRDIARWYLEQDKLIPVQDALKQTDLIRPGAVMFYGQSDIRYSDLSPEILFAPGKGISHIGVVISVQTDSNGVVMNYQLFNGHGRRGITPASTTNYHWRNPPRKTYPPYGNGRQQWVAVAHIVKEK